MKCEFNYCIYNENLICILSEPEINSMGICDSCIIVSFDEKFLEKEKSRQLREIEKRQDENI